MRTKFTPVAAPRRTPKPAFPTQEAEVSSITGALKVIRRLLRDMRWDDQGGYASFRDGKWRFVSTGLGQVSPRELDALFAFAGMTPDEIDVVGDCADCANSDDGRERGYVAPCVSCLRPSHINHFVPAAKVRRRR